MDSQNNLRPVISIVCPVFNEAQCIREFAGKLLQTLETLEGFLFEVIFIDDGSTDDSMGLLVGLAKEDERIKVIELSRNFGKEAALTAGFDFATGDAIISMDSDMQHPPNVIPKILQKWQEGGDIVIASRTNKKIDSQLHSAIRNLFYKIHNRLSTVQLSKNSGDFRLLNRDATEALKLLPERQRFMKGLFSWIGFKTDFVEYEVQDRLAGTTKFTRIRLWNLALEGITSFSTVPLKIWSYLGLVGASLSIIYASYIIFRTVTSGIEVPGYASLFTVILFFGSIQLIGIGVLGEYIGRIYLETKQRPIYLTRRVLNTNKPPKA